MSLSSLYGSSNGARPNIDFDDSDNNNNPFQSPRVAPTNPPSHTITANEYQIQQNQQQQMVNNNNPFNSGCNNNNFVMENCTNPFGPGPSSNINNMNLNNMNNQCMVNMNNMNNMSNMNNFYQSNMNNAG